MIENYLKLTFRNLKRNKFYTVINILGLSVGILCFILILLFINDELTYDTHHEKHKNIYGLSFSLSRSGTSARKWAPTAPALGPILKDEYPEIIEYVRFLHRPLHGTYKDKAFKEDRIFAVDATVFDIFTHKFLKGSPDTALIGPSNMVLTESLAHKYFGNENPIGKVIQTSDSNDLRISAVIEDLPANSHLKFDALISLKGIARIIGEEYYNSRARGAFWESPYFGYTYVLVNEMANMKSVIDKFHDYYKEHLKVYDNITYTLMATPLSKTHFRTGLDSDFPTGNIMYSYIFSTVAVFILLIAAINYMNMATARSAKRAKEIGIRKVVGARRGNIIRQFLIESLVISLLAMLISILLAHDLLPLFNHVSEKDLVLFSTGNIDLFIIILSVSILVGLISGSYPALYLARFAPVRIMADNIRGGAKSSIVRKILVTVQFIISILMIIGTLLVSSQLKYMQDKDLGFDKNNVMVIPIQGEPLHDLRVPFKTELLKHSAIENVSISSSVPGSNIDTYTFRIEQDGQMMVTGFKIMCVDYEFIDLMGIEVIKGRNFLKAISTDEYQGYIINEALIKAYELGDEALGHKMAVVERGGLVRDGNVIGVVRDFNFSALHNPITPLSILLRIQEPDWHRYINIRIKPGKIDEAIRIVEKVGKELNINSPIAYSFLDEVLNENYRYEEKLGQIFSYFSMLCIFISCLGLLGLSAFVAEQRTIEIGIRKVMGASTAKIVSLLSKDFVKLVIIANILAWPIGYYAATRWLENYTYRIGINITIFIIAGTLALLITLLTVGLQAFKAATANPVDSLRYE